MREFAIFVIAVCVTVMFFVLVDEVVTVKDRVGELEQVMNILMDKKGK